MHLHEPELRPNLATALAKAVLAPLRKPSKGKRRASGSPISQTQPAKRLKPPAYVNPEQTFAPGVQPTTESFQTTSASGSASRAVSRISEPHRASASSQGASTSATGQTFASSQVAASSATARTSVSSQGASASGTAKSLVLSQATPASAITKTSANPEGFSSPDAALNPVEPGTRAKAPIRLPDKPNLKPCDWTVRPYGHDQLMRELIGEFPRRRREDTTIEHPFPMEHPLGNRNMKQYTDTLFADGPFTKPGTYTHIDTNMALRIDSYHRGIREKPMMSAPPTIPKRLHPAGDPEELGITLIDIIGKEQHVHKPNLLRPVDPKDPQTMIQRLDGYYGNERPAPHAAFSAPMPKRLGYLPDIPEASPRNTGKLQDNSGTNLPDLADVPLRPDPVRVAPPSAAQRRGDTESEAPLGPRPMPYRPRQKPERNASPSEFLKSTGWTSSLSGLFSSRHSVKSDSKGSIKSGSSHPDNQHPTRSLSAQLRESGRKARNLATHVIDWADNISGIPQRPRDNTYKPVDRSSSNMARKGSVSGASQPNEPRGRPRHNANFQEASSGTGQ